MTGDSHIAAPARGPLHGNAVVPGDKSISHRVALFAAMAEGRSRLDGVLDAADVRATISAVSALGAGVEELERDAGGVALAVEGWGARGPRAQAGTTIDCGNSGTTARLLMGVLAGWPGRTYRLAGDASLSRRPMRRVADPLAKMGASVGLTSQGTLPAIVDGAALRGATFDLDVASAQVKSALLLAGVPAQGRTRVSEPAPSRDHTERLLPAFGVSVGRDEAALAAWVDGPVTPTAAAVGVPGDPSSAAFLVGAAVIVPDSELTLLDVGLNPTRTGFLGVLERMGASVALTPSSAQGPEPVGDISVAYSPRLRATTVHADEVPSLIDEVPLLAVVALRAEGTTRFEGVGELRVKESDRLEALTGALSGMGAVVRSGADWLEVDGPVVPVAATLDSLGDHRLAMAYAVAGLVAAAPIRIERFDAVEVSYPGFEQALRAVGTA